MIHVLVLLHKAKRATASCAMTSIAFTHKCHNKNNHEIRSLNMKSIFQRTITGQFWTQFNFSLASGGMSALDGTGGRLRF